ncbi:MAG: hypothetical protein RL026_2287, partial [Pseudomonadota bacterium]
KLLTTETTEGTRVHGLPWIPPWEASCRA